MYFHLLVLTATEPLVYDDQDDVYLILNAAHLLEQMVPTVLFAPPTQTHCVLYPLFFFLFFLSFVMHHICLCPHLSLRPISYIYRRSPAAWALASFSPAALLHMRPPLVRRWRFTVCSSWISTPLKVRQLRLHFHLNLMSCWIHMKLLMIKCAQFGGIIDLIRIVRF